MPGSQAPRSAEARPRQQDDPDDSLVVDRQAEFKVALVCDFARLTPAGDLMRPGNDLAFNLLEIKARLLYGELMVSAGFLEHVPARFDAAKRAAGSRGFNIGIE